MSRLCRRRVVIIGTINTADRSVALVDHALRRRFAFIALQPDYALLRRFHQDEKTGFSIDEPIAVLNELNVRIADPRYAIGFTYFRAPISQSR